MQPVKIFFFKDIKFTLPLLLLVITNIAIPLIRTTVFESDQFTDLIEKIIYKLATLGVNISFEPLIYNWPQLLIVFLLIVIAAILYPLNGDRVLDKNLILGLFICGMAFYVIGTPIIVNIFKIFFIEHWLFCIPFFFYSILFALGTSISEWLGTKVRNKIFGNAGGE